MHVPIHLYKHENIDRLIMFTYKPPAYESEVSQRLGQPGVAVGLAWTPMGGEILFVEATQMEGEGKVTMTGQLGDVMKESAELAMNWVRSHAKRVSTLIILYILLYMASTKTSSVDYANFTQQCVHFYLIQVINILIEFLS